ncbi:serendipity locus protein alpha [Zerene cesonia]|uniref:serendipity locus protein alpha n=1 Tax=Zerene cesonia TaxID=33412 RepID=UPI0018E59FAC|nr:serendipity locus protein alpha [Zerene cesonia]
MEKMEKKSNSIKHRMVRQRTRAIWTLLYREIRPLLEEIQEKLNNAENANDITNNKIWNVYHLCSDQIRKCVLIIIEILKFNEEFKAYEDVQESLQCVYERLSCCHEKLISIDEYIDKILSLSDVCTGGDDSIVLNKMYFVNWIDQTFEVLNNLSNVVYRNACKTTEEEYDVWQNELVTCVTGIHTCIDELLLCAMTLCKYCLPSDQLIVKARCQVVLRETKALLGDLIIGDLDAVFQASKETIKMPIKPSNINVLIDVLKDVLYVLETNTNTALLALLVHCFACNTSPVEILKQHLMGGNGEICKDKDHEDCEFVKEFDLYNERLMQIGSFAISCSSDDQRVLNLRSGLASLEALDPHLVPAVIVEPKSFNTSLLVDIWKREVNEIRDNVFLIVDPSAFVQKAKQMIHQKLLEIMKESAYDNIKTCSVINIGSIMKEFFDVYQTCEPDALPDKDKLLPLLRDLNKAQLECKVVSNILSSGDDFLYPTKKLENKEATYDQLLKRLKLLYTIVNRINTLLSPKESDEQLFEGEQSKIKSDTQTVNNFNTYVNSPRKMMNLTRSLFGRTTNIRSSTAKFPLAILTKNLKVRKDLSFSIKLDELCNDVSGIKMRNTSILYHSPMNNRSSLRKAVLSRHCMKTPESLDNDSNIDNVFEEDFMDEAMSLQITDVLNEINNLTYTRARQLNLTYDNADSDKDHSRNNVDWDKDHSRNNVLNISVNNETITKRVWNITVNSDFSSASQPSNVDTLERINDYNLVTSKLSDLRSVQLETSL